MNLRLKENPDDQIAQSQLQDLQNAITNLNAGVAKLETSINTWKIVLLKKMCWLQNKQKWSIATLLVI